MILEEYYKKNFIKHINAIKKKGGLPAPDSAFDIVQEAFLRACIGLKHFNPEKGNFGKWFSKILYRTYLDFLYHKHKEMEDINMAIALEDWIDYEIVYENREIINKAIEKLEEKYKLPIKLFYKEGYSVEQIHKITNLSETYIRQLCFRFKNTLKDQWSLEL